MRMPENVREIIKSLLKNDLITVKEVAMLNENKKEDREAIIEIINRIYQKRKMPCGEDVGLVCVSEDDILELLDYVTDEPVKEIISPIVIPQTQEIEFVPYKYPYRPYPGLDVVYCSTTA